jgi:hypothetical protein
MWERNIDNPNNITAKYIGCEIHLYIPVPTNGAPGFGIGETLMAGLKLMIAQARIKEARNVKPKVRGLI